MPASRQPITISAAKQAFERFYKNSELFASVKARNAARTYDLNHSKPKRIISDKRYLHPTGPYRYDFKDVDTGSLVRKPLSAKQIEILSAARAKLALKMASLRAQSRSSSPARSRSPSPAARSKSPKQVRSKSPKPKKVCKKVCTKVCSLKKKVAAPQVAGYWW